MTLNNWLDNIIKNETPDDSIVAYNFGLFNSDKGFTIYLIGSNEFDEEDSDWATNADFEPNQKYFELPSELKDESWKNIQQKMTDTLSEFLESEDAKKSFLSKSKAITLGFDDGDLIRLK